MTTPRAALAAALRPFTMSAGDGTMNLYDDYADAILAALASDDPYQLHHSAWVDDNGQRQEPPSPPTRSRPMREHPMEHVGTLHMKAPDCGDAYIAGYRAAIREAAANAPRPMVYEWEREG